MAKCSWPANKSFIFGGQIYCMRHTMYKCYFIYSACPSLVAYFNFPLIPFFQFMLKVQLCAASQLLEGTFNTLICDKLILQNMLKSPLQCMHYWICYMIRYWSYFPRLQAAGLRAPAAQLGFFRDLSCAALAAALKFL